MQAADPHCGLAARGRKTEKKKRRRPEERNVREDQQLKKNCPCPVLASGFRMTLSPRDFLAAFRSRCTPWGARKLTGLIQSKWRLVVPSSESLCLKTEKTHESAEKHEDTIKDVEKGTARVSESCVQFLGWYPPVVGLVAPLKCHTLLNSRCDLKRTPCTR